MAKGDRDKVQKELDANKKSAATGNEKQAGLTANQQQVFWDNYLNSTKDGGQYNDFINKASSLGGDTRSGYENFASGGNNYSWDPKFRQSLDSSLAGYQNFADTGGFSEQDKSDLRARAIAPTRAVYANAQSNVDRQRSLQGGYSPNYTAATAKMSRDLSSGLSDASTNANAQLAQMIQSGKLAGLGGLQSGSTAGQGLSNNINQLNSQQMLAGLSGMSDIDKMRIAAQLQGFNTQQNANQLYGNQALASTGQAIGQQNSTNQLGLQQVGQQIQQSQMPSNFQQALGNIGGVVNIAGQTASAISGLGGLTSGITQTAQGLPGYNNSGRY